MQSPPQHFTYLDELSWSIFFLETTEKKSVMKVLPKYVKECMVIYIKSSHSPIEH